jgi:hypothetical protein
MTRRQGYLKKIQKRRTNMEIVLEKSFDPDVFFLGTDAEIEEAEKEDERNRERLLNMARMIQAGSADYAYTDTRHANGRITRLVLHRSAKYDCLQLTCLNYQGGDFLYAVYDCRIDSEEKLIREWTGSTFFIE